MSPVTIASKKMNAVSCNEAVRGAPSTSTAANAAGSPKAKRTSGDLLEAADSRARKRPRTVPSAHKGGGRQRVEGRKQPVQRDVERARKRHQPDARQATEQEDAEPRAWTLAEDRRRQ